MNQLKVISLGGRLLVDSREVSEMVDKRHDHLLADIRKYIEILDSQDFGSRNFFIPSTYVNSQNKEQPCYLLTRKGCDMVANKLTGEKGVVFTATYVTQFELMEEHIQKQQPISIEDAVIHSMTELKQIKSRQDQAEEEMNKMKFLVDNEVWLTEQNKEAVQRKVKRRVFELKEEGYSNASYQAVYGALKKHFGVAKYDKIPRKYYQNAMKFVSGWYPPERPLEGAM